MTLVDDVKAFNYFQNDPSLEDAFSSHNSTTSHDYVPCVSFDGPCASLLTRFLQQLDRSQPTGRRLLGRPQPSFDHRTGHYPLPL